MTAPIAGVCVVGRLDFETGYGRITLAALELLSRYLPVVFAPSRGETPGGPIYLPSGRRVPLADQDAAYTGYLYCDVPWNGYDDHRRIALPRESFRVAHLAWDSDELPPKWVTTLNEQFDLCLFTSDYLSDVARRSGVEIDLGTLPVGLDFGEILAEQTLGRQGATVIFGSLSAFHPRKNLGRLVIAFAEEFTSGEVVELRLHSGLRLGDEFERVSELIASLGDPRIGVTNVSLSESEKNSFLRGLDIYVNVSAGEGYSIGPREALALGKSLVVSDISGHADLSGVPGVTMIRAAGAAPAVYPEISNQSYGNQAVIDVPDIRRALRNAYAAELDGSAAASQVERRDFASRFNLQSMSASYYRIFNVEAAVGDTPLLSTTRPLETVTAGKTGRHGSKVGTRRVVVPVHDGGYFSIFNVFLANLVWSELDDSIEMVLPDWRAQGLLDRLNGENPTSFCYSRPDQGNLWTLLYEPLYDLSATEMDSVEFLGEGAVAPASDFAEDKEPLLTYVNAFELYRAPWFQGFREQYHDVFRRHVRLLPEFRQQIDTLLPNPSSDVFRISAHVRHPSHAIEQPDGKMAGVDVYSSYVRRILESRGIPESSDRWELFLATDNERSIQNFCDIFGDRVRYVAETERASEENLQSYDSLEQAEAIRAGHQIQHLNATDPGRWSHLKAYEVWRDAELLAASDVVLHAVSNVATAVAFMNPRVEMVFCDPGG